MNRRIVVIETNSNVIFHILCFTLVIFGYNIITKFIELKFKRHMKSISNILDFNNHGIIMMCFNTYCGVVKNNPLYKAPTKILDSLINFFFKKKKENSEIHFFFSHIKDKNS
ncbi:hypothetical protein Glove_137g122 [Diversispora epigaea]|uniref:Uncharacterized protein n=1 Tax=Diversispora epigaea TaxID=1348612 RepID=A0A397IZ21_9GLOM|nr:hypothetical protein Glove_137g122 [Diversispora epigaea]